MDHAAFEEALKERCPSLADRAMAALESCVTLEVMNVGDDVPVGASKIGGAPDLPEDLEWPAWKDRPLDFLAQINLAEVAGFGLDTGLPQSGLLLFFADTLHCAGLTPSDREGFRVIWTEDDVQPRAVPEGNEHFPCGRVALCVETSVPAIGDPRLPEEDVADEDFDAFHDVRDEFSNRGGHQLLGLADSIQLAVERDTVHAVHGCTTETGGFDGDKWQAVKHEVSDWRLLLQINTDEDLDMMWGDAGKLYFTIRRDALSQPDTENTWFTFQN